MPSSTPKQARFMAAVAHGWHPDRVAAPPLKVAREFNQADAAAHTPHPSQEKSHAQRLAIALKLAHQRQGGYRP